MVNIYEGGKPFVFVSYSHKDTPYVMEVIKELDAKGIRIWYDAGIEAGSEWPEYIANHLTTCSCVLCFVSPNYADSDNCRRELTFSLNLKKPTLSLYMEQFQMSGGLQLQLGLVQAMFCDRFPTAEALVDELSTVPMVAACHTDGSDAEEEYVCPVGFTPIQQTTSNVTPLLKRAFMFLEDGDWDSADEYCEKVLDIEPECAQAYLGKLMTELKVRKQEELKEQEKPFDNNGNYKKAIRFADAALEATITGYIEHINMRIEEQRLAEVKREEKNRLARQKREETRRKQAEEKKKILLPVRQRLQEAQGMISAGSAHVIALKVDGKVLAAGSKKDGRCQTGDWTNIVSVAAADRNTVGLKADGTVVAAGCETYGRCDVSDWKNIVAISAGETHTVGLKADGTVVAAGNKQLGRCKVDDWTNIVAIAAGDECTVGLKADGTVVTTGSSDLTEWDDIVSVSAGGNIVGLKADGTVVVADTAVNWNNIVAVSAGKSHIVGLKADGTVVAAGDKCFGRCKVSGWTDIVAISAGDKCTIGLKVDGTVVVTSNTGSEKLLFDQSNLDKWKVFNNYDSLEEEKESLRLAKIKREEARIAKAKREQEARAAKAKQEQEERAAKAKCEEEMRQRRAARVCQHCGGQLKGLFSKKCTICGKPKDY